MTAEVGGRDGESCVRNGTGYRKTAGLFALLHHAGSQQDDTENTHPYTTGTAAK